MTPAYILSKAYVGLIDGGDAAKCEIAARRAIITRRGLLPTGSGWDICSRRGSDPPPTGAVLIGAVVCSQTGECDFNIFAHPVSPAAMLIKDRIRDHITVDEVIWRSPI